MVALALLVKGETARRSDRGFLADELGHGLRVGLGLLSARPAAKFYLAPVGPLDEFRNSLGGPGLDAAAARYTADELAVIDRKTSERRFRNFVLPAKCPYCGGQLFRFVEKMKNHVAFA